MKRKAFLIAALLLACVGFYFSMTVSGNAATPYDGDFFSGHSPGSSSSAAEILPDVLRLFPVHSAIDLGTGTGEWLGEMRKLGVTDVLGVDGDWVNRKDLKIPVANFKPFDLRNPLHLDRTFDLAISVETAEHLPNSRSEGFVSDLTALAPVVLFSAAIPGQGGTDHINEQWQDYWAKLFKQRNYVALDVLRLKFWNDQKIEWWYRQNIIVYVRKDVVDANEKLQLLASLQAPNVVRLKH